MKSYTFDGKTYTSLPDPLYLNGNAYSPMTEAKFEALGGVITDDGELTPKERFLGALNAYLDELEDKAKELALAVTKEDFIEAAANSKISTDLVDWAREKGVPDAVIAEARAQILTFLADAQRPEIGLTWSDIFPKQPSN